MSNIQVDTSVKKARNSSPALDLSFISLSLKSAIIWTKENSQFTLEDYWIQNAPHTYQDLRIDIFERCPRELTLSRPLLSHIYAARTGHCDFESYHECFKHVNYLGTRSCESPKSPIHVLDCSLPKPLLPKKRIYKNSRNAAQFYLGLFEGARLLTKWLDSTTFFTDNCPRFSITD